MKNTLLILLIFTISLSADLSIHQIQNMVKQIHKKREGVKLITLEHTKEPFISVKENNGSSIPTINKNKVLETKFILHAIVNSKVYINESWVKVGDNISGYVLKYIGNKGVVLRNKNHIKKLFLRKKRDNFIKIEEKQ